MRVAVKAAGPDDPEHLAWYRVHLGFTLMNLGRLAEAEREFDAALEAFPDYHIALAAKGRARMEAGDYEAAISFYKKAQERVPLPGTAIALVDLYTSLGRLDEAKRQEDFVEFIERAGAPGSVSYSRQLALFWADHDIRLDEAVEIMRRERAARSDIYTCDALAWCLFKKGELSEARVAIGEAMRLGTRDARIYYHAGLIHRALGDRANARRYLKLTLETHVSFDNSASSFTLLQAEAAKYALEAD
jgi:tetratricopeptide (TPR) repeat protein